jgi:hypothetical protein
MLYTPTKNTFPISLTEQPVFEISPEEMGKQLEKKMNKKKSSTTVLKPVINQNLW